MLDIPKKTPSRLEIKFGCLVAAKREITEAGGTIMREKSMLTVEYLTTTLELERPRRGIRRHQHSCEHCGKELALEIRSRGAVLGNLLKAKLRYMAIAGGVGVVLLSLFISAGAKRPEEYVLILVVMFALSFPLLVNVILHLMDYFQGNATSAVEWLKEPEDSDMNQVYKERQHEFLSIKRLS